MPQEHDGPETAALHEDRVASPREIATDGGTTGADAAESASDEPDEFAEELRELAEKSRLFLVASLSIALDLTFLTAWFGLTKLADVAFARIGIVPGVGEALRRILETFFDGATLAVVGAYVVMDVVRSVKRIWEKR